MHEENIRQDSSWRYVIQRALSNPEEIHMLDNRLRTALHCACAKRAPLEVVRILLTARGDGTISCDRNGNGNNESHMKSLLLKQDNHGRTPISVAIANNASLDVVQYLLRRCPESSKVADKSHNFPLHIACMGDYNENTVVVVLELLEAFKDAAGMLSRDKKTPLSLCVECGGSLAILQALVKGKE
jgi:ankyrin repeat protein